MKAFVLAIVSFLLFFPYPQITEADASTGAIHQTVESVEAARSDIGAAARNLTGMRDSLSGIEGQAIQNVTDEAWLLFRTAGEIVIVGDIYEKMKNKDDQLTVFQYFGNSARQYAKQVEISLPWINSCLTRITTPAALMEATKVRDKMLQVRMAAQQFESGT